MEQVRPNRVVAHRSDRPPHDAQLRKISEAFCPCGETAYSIFVDREFSEAANQQDVTAALSIPSSKLAEHLGKIDHSVVDDPHPDLIELNKL